MKIRSGFVSNSSSASFIVEVKHESWDKLRQTLFDSFYPFSKDGCLEKLKEKKEFVEKNYFKKSEEQIAKELKEIQDSIDYINEYKEPNWSEWSNEPNEKKKEFTMYLYNRYRQEVVDIAINTLTWDITKIDDGFISFNAGGPCCYNGWEDIRLHKEFIELIAYFVLFRYEIRTRIESHRGSF